MNDGTATVNDAACPILTDRCFTNAGTSRETIGYAFSRYTGPSIVRAASGMNQYMSGAGGTGFVVLDCTDPSAPVERGRVTLHAFVEDIVIAGNRAYVAASRSGLYVLDISFPTAPSILGFFDTQGSATGVFLDGAMAYVADGGAGGLVILDVSSPQAITRVGGIDTSGVAERVNVGAIGGARFHSWGRIRVIARD